MTTNIASLSKSLFAAAAALAVLGLGSTDGFAGANSAAHVVRPLAGLSFALGAKHAVGYFVAQRGGCDLTLLVGESGEQIAENPRGTAPARFNTLIGAGRTARIDTAEGPSVEFFCSTGSAWLTTRIIERIAYSAPTR